MKLFSTTKKAAILEGVIGNPEFKTWIPDKSLRG